jgi:hypothetical protein
MKKADPIPAMASVSAWPGVLLLTHRGMIAVTSTPGKGPEFTIALPKA